MIRHWTWWLFERPRAGAGFLAAGVTAVVLVLGRSTWPTISVVDGAVFALTAYIAVYLVVTVLAFTSVTREQMDDWARREDRGTVLQRYVLGTAPGPGVSLFFAVVALVVATVWLPGHGGTTIPVVPRTIVAAVLVVIGWASIVVSYAVTFYADNVVEDYAAFEFPGDDAAQWSDYVYFAVSVMATFGTTDVNVKSREARRTVTANAVIAFVYNTVTIAASVSALSK